MKPSIGYRIPYLAQNSYIYGDTNPILDPNSYSVNKPQENFKHSLSSSDDNLESYLEKKYQDKDLRVDSRALDIHNVGFKDPEVSKNNLYDSVVNHNQGGLFSGYYNGPNNLYKDKLAQSAINSDSYSNVENPDMTEKYYKNVENTKFYPHSDPKVTYNNIHTRYEDPSTSFTNKDCMPLTPRIQNSKPYRDYVPKHPSDLSDSVKDLYNAKENHLKATGDFYYAKNIPKNTEKVYKPSWFKDQNSRSKDSSLKSIPPKGLWEYKSKHTSSPLVKRPILDISKLNTSTKSTSTKPKKNNNNPNDHSRKTRSSKASKDASFRDKEAFVNMMMKVFKKHSKYCTGLKKEIKAITASSVYNL
jgi:hypothetical protein